MKLALMQPYFFPYLGYFQLIEAVDTFVVYDDVQYMKGGWINRNRILHDSSPKWISLPVSPQSVKDHICHRSLSEKEYNKACTRILGQLHASYRKAPFYDKTRSLIEGVLSSAERNLASYIYHSLRETCRHIGIETPLSLSSMQVQQDSNLAGQDRVIAICRAMGADTYVNPIGGRELYRASDFEVAGLDLRFIEMHPVSYDQRQAIFTPHLSIIDVMMFNDVATIRHLLEEYTLIPGNS